MEITYAPVQVAFTGTVEANHNNYTGKSSAIKIRNGRFKFQGYTWTLLKAEQMNYEWADRTEAAGGYISFQGDAWDDSETVYPDGAITMDAAVKAIVEWVANHV